MGSIPDQAKVPHASGPKIQNIKKKKKRILLTNSVKTLKTFHILIKKANTKRHSRDPGTSQGKALQLVP